MNSLKCSNLLSSSWDLRHHLRLSWSFCLRHEAFLDFLNQECSLPYLIIHSLWFVSFLWSFLLSTNSYNSFHASLTMPLCNCKHLIHAMHLGGTQQTFLDPHMKWNQPQNACIWADMGVQQDSCKARWHGDLRANGYRPPQSTKALFSRPESAGSLPVLSVSQRGPSFPLLFSFLSPTHLHPSQIE